MYCCSATCAPKYEEIHVPGTRPTVETMAKTQKGIGLMPNRYEMMSFGNPGIRYRMKQMMAPSASMMKLIFSQWCYESQGRIQARPHSRPSAKQTSVPNVRPIVE